MPVGAGSIKRAARTADAAKNLTEETATEKDKGKTKGEVLERGKAEKEKSEKVKQEGDKATKSRSKKAGNKTDSPKGEEKNTNKKSEKAAVEKTKNEQNAICGIGQELPIYLL